MTVAAIALEQALNDAGSTSSARQPHPAPVRRAARQGAARWRWHSGPRVELDQSSRALHAPGQRQPHRLPPWPGRGHPRLQRRPAGPRRGGVDPRRALRVASARCWRSPAVGSSPCPPRLVGGAGSTQPGPGPRPGTGPRSPPTRSPGSARSSSTRSAGASQPTSSPPSTCASSPTPWRASSPATTCATP